MLYTVHFDGVSIAGLESSPVATSIVLRTSPADGNWDIFCGDMQAPALSGLEKTGTMAPMLGVPRFNRLNG